MLRGADRAGVLRNAQISDNPELFQPLVEENIRAANAGEIINDKVWGHKVRAFPAQLHAPGAATDAFARILDTRLSCITTL